MNDYEIQAVVAYILNIPPTSDNFNDTMAIEITNKNDVFLIFKSQDNKINSKLKLTSIKQAASILGTNADKIIFDYEFPNEE